MKRERFGFGVWTPDLPPLRNQNALTVCKNVLPVSGGYGPFGSLVQDGSGSLGAAPRGSLRGRLSDGTNLIFAATDTTIERLQDGTWNDVSRTGDPYTPVSQALWDHDQFGTNVFFTNRADALQGMNLAEDSQFSDVPDAPRAAHMAVAENFLILGDIIDSQGVARDAVAWSGINSPYLFPDPTSDAATAVLSGRQVLEGNGGLVMEITAGAEVAAVFQENAIHRMDFVGNDVVWQFTRAETEHGLIVAHAAVPFERQILYLADDGFRVFNYTASQNIGKDRVNDFFMNDWDRDYPDSISMLRDPQQTRIYISYAGSGHTAGVPNKMVIWDFALDQWSAAEPGDHYPLSHSGGVANSLDSPDTPEDPDVLGTDPGDGSDDDPPGDESFDTRQLGVSRVSIGAFDATFKLGAFNGDALPGVLETGDYELAPGMRSMLTSVRPQVDGGDTNVQVASFSRRSSDTLSVAFGSSFPMETDGACYMRANDRYHRLRFNLPTALTEATEFDAEFRPTGTR